MPNILVEEVRKFQGMKALVEFVIPHPDPKPDELCRLLKTKVAVIILGLPYTQLLLLMYYPQGTSFCVCMCVCFTFVVLEMNLHKITPWPM